MPDKNPFAPSGTLAFLTGLTGSTIDTFRKESEQAEAERKRAQSIDYELLMAGLKQLEPNLTPTQAKEVMTRAVDIFKPKGHGGIKEKLAEMFGHGTPHEMQAGRILNDAANKPRLQVTPAVSGGTGDSVFGNVTLPPPPDMPATYEKTYREQDIADDSLKYGYQLDVALAKQENAQRLKDQSRREQNQAGLEIFKTKLGLTNDAKAMAKVKEVTARFSSDTNDPEAQALAREWIANDLQQKAVLAKAQLALKDRQLTAIDEKLKQGQQRIDIANRNATTREQVAARTQAIKYRDDPQWKGMWLKAGASAQAAKLARGQAAEMYAKFMAEKDEDWLREAKKYEEIAKGLEDDVQKQVDGMENREYTMSGGTKMGGVSLPGNPAGASRRPWSASKWAATNPGGDVNRAKTAAAARGDKVVQ